MLFDIHIKSSCLSNSLALKNICAQSMIGLFTIILPFLLLSKEYMFDGGMNMYTPSRGFGKRSPVMQEEGLPNVVI